MTWPESIAVTRVSGRNTRRRRGDLDDEPDGPGRPLGRTSTTTSRTRPTWSPRGSNTLVPARRATNTLVPTLLTSVSLDRAPDVSRRTAGCPAATRASPLVDRAWRSLRPWERIAACRSPVTPDPRAPRRRRRARRSRPTTPTSRRSGPSTTSPTSDVPGAAGHDRRYRPADGRAGHRAAVLPPRRARRVPLRRVVRALRRAPAHPVLPRTAQQPARLRDPHRRRVRHALLGGHVLDDPRASATSRRPARSSRRRTRCCAGRSRRTRRATCCARSVASSPAGRRRPPAPSPPQPVGSVGCVPACCGSQPWRSPPCRRSRPPGPPAPPPGPPSAAARADVAPPTGRRPRPDALADRRCVGVRRCGSRAAHLGQQRERPSRQQCEFRRSLAGRGSSRRRGDARRCPIDLSRRETSPSTPRRRPGPAAARPRGSRSRPR